MSNLSYEELKKQILSKEKIFPKEKPIINIFNLYNIIEEDIVEFNSDTSYVLQKDCYIKDKKDYYEKI